MSSSRLVAAAVAACLLASLSAVTAAAPAGASVAGAPPGSPRGAAAVIDTGYDHTCAIVEDGAVKCWGNNNHGQLGLGDTTDRGDQPGEMGAALPAVDLGPGRTAVAVTAGDRFTCVLLDTGAVKCWGFNASGQLGLGDTATRGDAAGEMGAALPAVDLGPGNRAVALAAGIDHTCAILQDGTVKCWGRNSPGRLGLGDVDDRGDAPGEMGSALPAVDLGPGRTATAIAAGDYHTCAILDDATLKCWGDNSRGQLGLGDTAHRGDQPGEMGASLPTVDLGPGRTVAALAAGSFQTCAIVDDGTVRCWGENEDGRLGLGDTADRGDQAGEMGAALPPVDLGGGRTALAIATGGDGASCAVTDTGAAKCWGFGALGRLGYGDTAARGDGPGEMGDALPVIDLGAGRRVRAISVGAQFVCAALDNARVKCWGGNSRGQLGLGDTANRGDQPGEMGASLPAVPIDPTRLVVPVAAAPAPPTDVSVTAGDAAVLVEWTAPADDGGSALTGHRVQVSADGVTWTNAGTAAASATRVLIDGLTNATAYRARVIAINAIGASPPSQPAGPTTPTAGLAVPGQCPTTPHGFTDVPTSSFAFTDIACIKGLGITTGTSPTTYSPAESVTREQMAAFLARLWRATGETCLAVSHGFSDVASTSFAVDDIACIKALGITTGTTPTTYSPAESVTREQMAAFLARLWRATGNTCPTTPHGFTDVPITSFADTDIACIKALGITTGTTPTTYTPAGTVTREQMAAFLARLWRALG